jgi:hypothetical protein
MILAAYSMLHFYAKDKDHLFAVYRGSGNFHKMRYRRLFMESNCYFIPFSQGKKYSGQPARFCLIIAVILFTGLFLLNESIFAQGPPRWVANELLVTFHPGVAGERIQDIYHRHGATFIDEIPGIKTHLIRVPSHALEKVQRALSHRPEVEFVEKNRAFAPDLVPNDPYYPNQWHLAQIKAPQAWDITQGAADVIIAILDSGVDASHNDLSDKLVFGYNFYDYNTDTSDVYGHGTPVAGAAAAAGNNGIGVAGVAWGTRIMPIRVTSTDGWAYTSTISTGLTWAVDNGARVMNLSFSGVAGSQTIRNAAQYVVDRGGVVVAAAGNCGCNDSTAEAPYIVSVSATDSRDDLAYFSSRGDYVDVSAPGLGIWSTTRGGGYGSVSGTSFSSPVTAGVVALMLSANPDLTSLEVMEILENTTDDLGPVGYDTSFGFGRVNAYEAVLTAMASLPQPDTTPPSTHITSPAKGAIVSGTINVSVQAPDNVATVSVELYLDGELFATDTATPFTFVWDTGQAQDGDHTLQAVARDAAGNSGYSDSVTVMVDNSIVDINPPEVSITFPPDGSVVSGTISVMISETDDIGVTMVALYLDGGLMAEDYIAPFSFTWDTTRSADGPHTLQARAYDAAGNEATSAEVTVAVENPLIDNIAPTVNIITPKDGSTVSKVVKINIKAKDDSQLNQVQLFLDDNLFRTAVCNGTYCSVQIAWNTRKEATGKHSLTATASDVAGNVGTTSDPVNIYVK